MIMLNTAIPAELLPYFQKLVFPKPESHKGQNGKLMIIGGSELFHAASKWSLDIASKFVDMVFYSSVPSNNELIREAKGNFWNGIVVPRDEVEKYIEEADCILIGPGMERTVETENITNTLLQKFPTKKWVVDAGALQMIDPKLLDEHHIITPHYQEFEGLWGKVPKNHDVGYDFTDFDPKWQGHKEVNVVSAQGICDYFQGVTFLLTGTVDTVATPDVVLPIEGGNAGMTKGGTGDVLAGLVAALYCTNDALTACVVGSYVSKKAGEKLFETVGPNFNASDLVNTIPEVLWEIVHQSK